MFSSSPNATPAELAAGTQHVANEVGFGDVHVCVLGRGGKRARGEGSPSRAFLGGCKGLA